jgi:CDGSH-type Zn-finger protein/uncharacterized Fe-S cluster protein YjdI
MSSQHETGEPKIRIETREELIYLLAEAAAIEHNIMCCYLYAAWSLKRDESHGLTPEQVVAVKEWRAAIISVAVEEMSHLALVSNLTSAIGAGPHFSRPNFPIPQGYHPSGVTLELERFSPDVLDHFIFLERPEGKALHDASEFVHPLEYHRKQLKGRLTPSAQDYTTVGHLYRGVRHGLEVLTRTLGEKELFCGGSDAQIGPGDASLPGLSIVTDLKSAEAAVETIIEQGEGAPTHHEQGHYNRFLKVRESYRAFVAENPDFDPAFPVAHNPVSIHPMDRHDRIYINAPETTGVLDLANALYVTMLRCLVQSYGRGPEHQADKHLFVGLAMDLMFALDTVAKHLATLPANHAHPGVNAGMTFSTLRDVQRLPDGEAERRVLRERIEEIAHHAERLFPEGHALAKVPGRLHGLAAKTGPSEADSPAKPAHKPDDVPHAEASVDSAESEDLTLHFDGKRCIHARFCVLGAPSVFKANTPGKWLYPETTSGDTISRIAHNCPSGAITYDPKGDLPAEEAPPVNTVNVRENGPYAFRGPLKLRGEDIGFRATLCRCGASKNKPFCDCSHNDIEFRATGEPAVRPSEPLAVRDGDIQIEPERNGPLVVKGNLEICAGTGHTIDRVTQVRLCRCGGSHTKPFCDMTHRKIGFQAD